MTEMSCGWTKLELKQAQKDLTKFKLEVKGGSPKASVDIEAKEVKEVSNKSLLGGLLGSNTNTSILHVSTKAWKLLENDTILHMQMLPSLCLIHKRLIHFVSGFRNYAGQKLLKESSLGEFKQPGGNVAIACFPAIIDNPDILEVLVQEWNEYGMKDWSQLDKRKIELSMRKSEEYLQKLYPVLFSDDFDLGANTTVSVCDDKTKLFLRRDLIMSALRYDSKKKTGKAPKKSIEEMTTFKPFNVREIQFEVWDTSHATNDQIMQKYDAMGMLDKTRSTMQQNQTNIAKFINNQEPIRTGLNYQPPAPASHAQAYNQH